MTDPRKIIDTKKHILWSRNAEKAIRRDLEERYPERIEELWERTVLQYAEYLKGQPYIGGRRNRQAPGVYDSIMIFSYYTALPEKISKEELEKVNNEVFLPVYRPLEGRIDANRHIVMRIMHLAFRIVEKQVHRNQKNWMGNYHMEVKPLDITNGIEYRFTSCPIADFARRVGLEDLMPCLCNADYPMLEQMKAGLIRKHTCANGDYCDYHIVGDESKELDEHPAFRDEDGYIRNK